MYSRPATKDRHRGVEQWEMRSKGRGWGAWRAGRVGIHPVHPSAATEREATTFVSAAMPPRSSSAGG